MLHYTEYLDSILAKKKSSDISIVPNDKTKTEVNGKIIWHKLSKDRSWVFYAPILVVSAWEYTVRNIVFGRD